MPTRYLKPGIRDSELIDQLSPMAETLFTRLLVTVDDFGRTDARPSMIKSACYPIKATVNEQDCDHLLAELDACGLVHVYAVAGKPYLQMGKWDNIPRAKHSKFPAYADGCAHVYTSADTRKENQGTHIYRCAQMHADAPVTVTVTGTETKTGTGTETAETKKRGKRFDATAIDLPAWLDAQAWAAWVSDRSKRGKPVTEAAARLQVKQLGDYLAAGHLPESVIEHSIAGGFQGLYPPRLKGVHGGDTFQERADRHARDSADRLINGTPPDHGPDGPDVFDADNPGGLQP